MYFGRSADSISSGSGSNSYDGFGPPSRFFSSTCIGARKREPGLRPAYEFEPEADELLEALLPKYLNTRIYAALLDSAASESASRRRAMKSASDNADDLLKRYTRAR